MIDTVVIVLSFLGDFCFDSKLMNDIDDDDNMDGGMMIPKNQGGLNRVPFFLNRVACNGDSCQKK